MISFCLQQKDHGGSVRVNNEKFVRENRKATNDFLKPLWGWKEVHVTMEISGASSSKKGLDCNESDNPFSEQSQGNK